MNNLLKILKESGIGYSGALVTMVLNYVLLIVITRFLTPHDYGIFVLAMSVCNIFLILALFGTPKALDRYIPFYNAVNEQGKVKTLIYSILKITLALSVVTVLILFIAFRLFSDRLFDNSDLGLILRAMILTIPLLVFIQLICSIFIGLKEIRYQVYLQQLFFPLFRIILAVIILSLGFGLWGWVWVHILSVAATSILALWLLRKYVLSTLANVQKAPVDFREIASYSWPLCVTANIMMILGQIDFLFLGYFRPSEEVAIYKVYLHLLIVMMLVLTSFMQIYKPVISGLISENRLIELKNVYKQISKWFFMINSFGFLCMILFGMDIISILFPKAYSVAPAAFFILATGHFINSITGPDGTTLEAFGATKLMMINSLVMLAVNVLLDYLLIPIYGLTGAAIATASAVTSWHLLGLLEVYILYKLQPFTAKHLRYAAVGMTTAGILYLLRIWIGSDNVLNLLFLVILFAVLYVSSLHFSRSFDKADYEALGYIKLKLLAKIKPD